jgi:plasmid stabilization system protein ParE
MTLRVVFQELAVVELNEAAAFYGRARPGLGVAFLDAVEIAVNAVASHPLGGRAIEGDVRLWLVRRFPYRVFYRVCDDHVRVLAIGHQKRSPAFWHGRV